MPVDNITVSNQNVILQGGDDQDGIQFVPNGGVQHSGTDYGAIESVSVNPSSVTVVTDQGTLTFSGPQLDEAKSEFTSYDIQSTYNNVHNSDDVTAELMRKLTDILLEMQLHVATSDRSVRQARRATAKSETLAAAAEIMEGALTNLILGCVGGGLSILGGALAGVGSLKAASSLGESMDDVKISRLETKASNVQSRISETDVEIAQTKSSLKTLNDRIDDGQQLSPDEQNQKLELENKLANLESRKERLVQQKADIADKLSKQIDELKADYETAQQDEVDAHRKANPQPDQVSVQDENGNFNAAPERPQQSRMTKAYYLRKERLAKARQVRIGSKIDKLEQLQAKISSFDDTPAPTADNVPQMQAVKLRADAWDTQANVKLKENWGEFSQKLTYIQMQVQKWAATQQVLDGSGNVSKSVGGFEQTQAEADAKEHDANSQEAASFQQEADADYNHEMDLASKFLDIFDAFFQGSISSQQQIWA